MAPSARFEQGDSWFLRWRAKTKLVEQRKSLGILA
jgi:hypothetical protein